MTTLESTTTTATTTTSTKESLNPRILVPVKPNVIEPFTFPRIVIPPGFFPTSKPFLNTTSNSSFVSLSPVRPLNKVLCAPFPPCNPLGCGPGIAPVNCPDCNGAATAFVLFGMCLLAMLIVFTNVLVIGIITRNESLFGRHGYIKVSLAVADLLIGLLVIPAAIYNLATTLYIPTSLPNVRLLRLGINSATKFAQKNSLASVFFGTVFIISLTASINNLLLLTVDRLIAVAKPVQTRTGKYLSARRIKYCLVAIWLFGVLLSSLPAFIPSRFSYQLDGTTFYFVQTINTDNKFSPGAVAVFSFLVMGLPFLSVVVLNFITLALTIKKLKFRRKHSRKVSSSEQKRRLKMILESCPEMKHRETKKGLLKKFICNQSNNSRSKSSLSANRKKPVPKLAEELNSRVSRMILTMVVVFTICMLPYTTINISLAVGSLDCSNVGVAYNFALYLLLFNSASNFFVYNLWHKEFREKLLLTLKRQKTSHKSTTTSTTGTGSSNRICHSASLPAHQRLTGAKYQIKRSKNVACRNPRQAYEESQV